MINVGILWVASIISVLLFGLLLKACFEKCFDQYRQNSLFKYYPERLILFDRARDMAYSKIFRSHVLVQLGSGFKLNNEELEVLRKEYIEVVFTFCGPRLVSDMIELQGDLDSITAYLVNDLAERIGNDELMSKGGLAEAELDPQLGEKLGINTNA